MKVRSIWIVIAALAAFALGALLFRGCGKTKTVRYCPPVNVDSLIATLPKDTVLVPDPDNQVVKWLPRVIDLTDTAAVDSLLAVLIDQKQYYSALVDRLGEAIGKRDSALADAHTELERLELIMRTNIYQDSARTEQYFHRWRIEAEGPIRSYSFGIVPICPPQPTIPKVKHHRAGLYIGGQAEGGAIRPVYTARYGYRFIGVQAAYLPKSTRLGTAPAFQFSAGIDVPIR